MKKLQQYGLKKVSNAALRFAVGSVCKTSCVFFHQPKMTEDLKNRLKEKKSRL